MLSVTSVLDSLMGAIPSALQFIPPPVVMSWSHALSHTHTLTRSHLFSFALSLNPHLPLEAGARRHLVGGPVLEAGGGLGQRFSGQSSDTSARGFVYFPINLTKIFNQVQSLHQEDLIHHLCQILGNLSLRLFLPPPLLVSLFPPAPLLSLLPPLVFLPVLRHTGSLGTGTAGVPETLLTSFC